MNRKPLLAILRSALALATALPVVWATTGCVAWPSSSASSRAQMSAFENPPIVHPTETSQVIAPHNEGSLFNPASNSWSPWSEVTAQAVGDIVTVRVTINTNAEGSATTDLSRESNIDAGIQSLFGKETSLPGVAAAATSSNSATPASGTSPAHLIQASSTSTFKGDGDTKRTGKIVADISCVVTQVSPNGNLSIHGSQSTLINHENSILTVDGTVRRTDITTDNIVTSDRIANSRIEITGKGIISDKQKPGTWGRVFDWVWPF